MKFNCSNFIGVMVCVILVLHSCKPIYNNEYKVPNLVDNKLNRSARKLHKKLTYITKKGFAIGHQDATSYGVGWKSYNADNTRQSDIFDIINDNPLVYGFDIARIEIDQLNNIDSVPFSTIRNEIINIHKKGGIITMSWHTDNPVTNGNSWDKTPAVNAIFTNDKIKLKYDIWLNKVALFIKTLKYKGKPIPILFRPYHEMNGHWFWWGDPNCSVIDYVRLWRKTVKTLRDKYKLHNLLYVYSANRLNPDDDYLKYYPGDNYVDILGIDIYDFNNSEVYANSVVKDLALVKKLATEKEKLFAFTETGLEKIPTTNWFTEVLYPAIKDSGISWILFWRNAHKTHHYLPYKTHKNAEDFKIFADYSNTLFMKDIKEIKY